MPPENPPSEQGPIGERIGIQGLFSNVGVPKIFCRTSLYRCSFSRWPCSGSVDANFSGNALETDESLDWPAERRRILSDGLYAVRDEFTTSTSGARWFLDYFNKDIEKKSG